MPGRRWHLRGTHSGSRTVIEKPSQRKSAYSWLAAAREDVEMHEVVEDRIGEDERTDLPLSPAASRPPGRREWSFASAPARSACSILRVESTIEMVLPRAFVPKSGVSAAARRRIGFG